MTALIVMGVIAALFLGACLIGVAMHTPEPPLHDGATMRDQRRQRWRDTAEQTRAAAADFEREAT